MLSSKCILHRQSTYEDGNNIGNTFYNFSTYANKNMFNHLKCSFDRHRLIRIIIYINIMIKIILQDDVYCVLQIPILNNLLVANLFGDIPLHQY